MELKVERFFGDDRCTIGRLTVDGRPECFTLEDVVRPDSVKVDGRTAIPAGRYRVLVTFSPRFKRDLPALVNVPMYAGVRIHPGNTDADTEGCLLVGQERVGDTIRNSRAAMEELQPKIQAAINAGGQVWITIVNAFPTAVHA